MRFPRWRFGLRQKPQAGRPCYGRIAPAGAGKLAVSGKLTIKDLAGEAGLSVPDVKNKLNAARARLRLTITALVRDLTTSPSELNHELETILGAGA